MKMVIAQRPPHQQQQERNRNKAQILEKWKTLLQQNLHRCGNYAEVQQQ